MESVIVFHIYAELFYSFEFFLSKFFQTNLFSPDSIKTGYYAIEGSSTYLPCRCSSTYFVDVVVLTLPTHYLFLPKKSCMSNLHSSSNTPDVTVVLGCRALGANLE